ncbi:hypothetical protein E4U41_002546 [Claviceps citrina]|nr:hypothetical protein E4U41_002546 [Claviceps citrina]
MWSASGQHLVSILVGTESRHRVQPHRPAHLGSPEGLLVDSFRTSRCPSYIQQPFAFAASAADARSACEQQGEEAEEAEEEEEGEEEDLLGLVPVIVINLRPSSAMPGHHRPSCRLGDFVALSKSSSSQPETEHPSRFMQIITENMIFSSRHQVDIPDVDLLTYLFETPAPPRGDSLVFVDAERPAQGLRMPELKSCVERLAGGLREKCHVRNGHVVLVYAENSTWYPVIILGTICAGAIFTGANPGYTSIELAHQLKTSGASCILTDPERLETAREAARAVGLPDTSIVLVNQGEDQSANHGLTSIDDLLACAPYSWEVMTERDVLADRIAALNFSSGTTGSPKACMISHRNLVANAQQQLHLDEAARKRSPDPRRTAHDVHCAFLPLYHASGLVVYCIVNLRRSCTTVIMRKFSLSLLLGTIQRFRVTYLFLAPPVVVTLAKSDLVARHDLSSVQSLFCGAAPLRPELSRKLEVVFAAGGARTRQGWGMTEATMAVTLFAPDEHDPSHRGVGYLVPNMQMKIVGPDGRPVGCNEEGEALLRGPNLFRGYHRDPGATRQAWTEDGWMKTGDIVTMSEAGLLTIVNRKKELIKVKGFQVAPSELEGHLLAHEAVKDCAVIRVIRDGQEHPQAHVVPRDGNVTAASIMSFMDARLSSYKRLSGGIVFTDAIPKSASGKILHRLLRDPHAAPSARL